LESPDDKKGLNNIIEAITGISKPKKLENTKIGLVGEPSDWLVASSPSADLVKETWGAEVIKIDINEIMDAIKNIGTKDTESMLTSLSKEASAIIEPTNADIENNVKVYLALKAIINKHNLNAITIRCFDLVLDIKTTGCFGLAQLNDEGYIAGCEGDLVSTVGMLWIYQTLNQIPWMANPAQINVEKNTLWLAHCTVPRSIVNNYDLRSHFESGIGVGIQGEFGNGPVTLLRLGGKRIEKMWVAEGEIIQTGNSEHLCRTQIEIQLTNGNVNDLLNSPLGNHIILVKGHFSDQLKN
jgi:L-fucose isomerase-like protein